jgi:Type III restriction enzyme, res subunit/Helicase C-terminal domain
MAGKLASLTLTPRKRLRLTDPEEIFKSLTLRGGVENIWEPQAAALRQWYAKRHEPRTVLEMNTGGGKTLIALLIAQSMVNETNGNVLYVCPTIQLIEQTRLQAKACSLETAGYYGGSWYDQDILREARGPCVTNYAALCNGKSIFRRESLAAMILDDAHVASPSIRSCFTLRLPSCTTLFNNVIALFRPYLENAGQRQQLASLLAGDPMPLLFVPEFELNRRWQQLTNILLEGGIAEERSTLFAWEHLMDRIDRSCVLISASRVEIAPVVSPISALPQLSECPRVIYMTATLPSPAQFARTFGPGSSHVIRPGGKSGEAQRLLVFAPGETEDEQRDWVKGLIRNHKACIITASGTRAQHWTGEAILYDGESGQAGVEEFKLAQPPEKLVMAARYDGIDLPGDSCRLLVLDGLPLGSFMIDRFADEILHVEGLRASSTAIRVTQAIGRIFRSNTDHGVVVLCGTDLQNWVRAPQNQSYLPELLQRHLQLAIQLHDLVKTRKATYGDLIDGILAGDPDWDRLYNTIAGYDVEVRPAPADWLVAAAGQENEAFGLLWEGNFADAAQLLALLVGQVEPHDRALAAWYRHWMGFAQERLRQPVPALHSYVTAANERAQLGRPNVSSKSAFSVEAPDTPGLQAEAVGALARNTTNVQKSLAKVNRDLVYGENTKAAESALEDLGRLLGLTASRPDNDKPEGTGPDVLWRYTPSKTGVALEAKTAKKLVSQYQKTDDIGQFHDHVQYLRSAHPGETFFKTIVGPILPVSRQSHPPEDLRVVSLEEFQKLAERVKMMNNYIATSTDGDPLPVRAQRWLSYLGLEWPQCFDALPFSLATDLQRDETSADEAS